MRYKLKKDEFHTKIAGELETMGFFVADTSKVGGGFPDLCISKHGVWALAELKTPRGHKTASERRNKAQIDFGSMAKGPVITAYTSHEIAYDFNLLLKRREGFAL